MRLNKALGQNFFNNPNLADWIVSLATAHQPQTVVEIGPGDGYFSKRLYEKTSRLILIEKDPELAGLLKLKLPNATIVNEDVLDWRFESKGLDTPIVIYGSLPYNISKLIISKFIRHQEITKMYFIIQKEVAEKYTSKDGQSSLLSLTANLFADFRILKIIKPGNFIPKPKVDSALIEVTPHQKPKYTDIPKFERVAKAAFSSPRKTLRNNLKGFNTSNIKEEILNKRPETLTLNEFIGLTDQIVL